MIALERLQVPQGFEEQLHDLIKEVLREQPADVLAFCNSYFLQRKGQPPGVFARNAFGQQREEEIAAELREAPAQLELGGAAAAAEAPQPSRQPTETSSEAEMPSRSRILEERALSNRPLSQASVSSESCFQQSRIEAQCESDSYLAGDEELLRLEGGESQQSLERAQAAKGQFKIKKRSRASRLEIGSQSLQRVGSVCLEQLQTSVLGRLGEGGA